MPEEEGGDTHSAAAYAVADEVAEKKGYEEGHEVGTDKWVFPYVVGPWYWKTSHGCLFWMHG